MRGLAFALLVSACGATSSSTTVADPDDPALEVDPQPCEVDADCMVGTPRDCCASFCPTDRQAWSVAGWNAYQADCAEEECAVLEDAACLPDDPGPATAICVEHRCALSFP